MHPTSTFDKVTVMIVRGFAVICVIVILILVCYPRRPEHVSGPNDAPNAAGDVAVDDDDDETEEQASSYEDDHLPPVVKKMRNDVRSLRRKAATLEGRISRAEEEIKKGTHEMRMAAFHLDDALAYVDKIGNQGKAENLAMDLHKIPKSEATKIRRQVKQVVEKAKSLRIELEKKRERIRIEVKATN